jgi:hypothetical protein
VSDRIEFETVEPQPPKRQAWTLVSFINSNEWVYSTPEHLALAGYLPASGVERMADDKALRSIDYYKTQLELRQSSIDSLRARLAEAEAERDRADYGLKVTAEARDRHRIEADSYKEMLRCRGNTLDRLGAELDAAQSDLAQAREELAALREGDELECISAVNTHPTLVEQDKQVRLFVEWAKRCVEQANREGRYYLECVCRMSPRDKLSALPGGEAKVVAARVNPMNTWCSHCYHGDGHCDGGRPGCTCPCRHAAAEPAPNPPAAPSAALSKCMSGKCDECNRAAQSAHRADSGGEGAK